MIQVSDISNKLTKVRNGHGYKVLSTGSHQLDKRVKLIKGFPWFIGGQSHHGKSEVTMELLLLWSKRYNWKHYCYFGEAGEIEYIVADLCYKLIGKPYQNNIPGHMSESERMYAEQFISEHFFFADPNEDFTYEQYLKQIEESERKLGFKFDTTTIDPFNDMEYDLSENITYWLKRILKDCRKQGMLHNRVPIFVVHVADVAPVTKDGETFFPPALPTNWEGGKIWNRRGFVQLGVWKDLNSNTRLMVHKAKPKQAKIYGADGDCIWEWDWKTNRYKEEMHGVMKFVLDDTVQNRSGYLNPIQTDDEPPF